MVRNQLYSSNQWQNPGFLPDVQLETKFEEVFRPNFSFPEALKLQILTKLVNNLMLSQWWSNFAGSNVVENVLWIAACMLLPMIKSPRSKVQCQKIRSPTPFLSKSLTIYRLQLTFFSSTLSGVCFSSSKIFAKLMKKIRFAMLTLLCPSKSISNRHLTASFIFPALGGWSTRWKSVSIAPTDLQFSPRKLGDALFSNSRWTWCGCQQWVWFLFWLDLKTDFFEIFVYIWTTISPIWLEFGLWLGLS